jgi:hypothetical protein
MSLMGCRLCVVIFCFVFGDSLNLTTSPSQR